MAFDYATAKTKLNNYLTAKVNTDAALAAIVALGPRPVFPDDLTSQADYNTATSDQANWDAAMIPLQTDYDTGYTAMRSIEFELIFFMQPNQWVKFVNTAGGVLTYTLWVAYNPNDAIDPENGPIELSGGYSDRQFCVFSTVQPPTSFYKTTEIPA